MPQRESQSTRPHPEEVPEGQFRVDLDPEILIATMEAELNQAHAELRRLRAAVSQQASELDNLRKVVDEKAKQPTHNGRVTNGKKA